MTPDDFRNMRVALGWTQAHLAALWGMPPDGERTIRGWERGERDIHPIAAFALDRMSKADERDPDPTPPRTKMPPRAKKPPKPPKPKPEPKPRKIPKPPRPKLGIMPHHDAETRKLLRAEYSMKIKELRGG
jgi:outer membrane biosynthesis protein TonB